MALKGHIPWNKKHDLCTIEGCGKKHDSHGLCHSHAEKKRRLENPKEFNRKRRLQYNKNKEVNQRKGREFRQFLRLVAITIYSNETYKCNCCGEEEYMFLVIDHEDNNGAEHRRQIGGVGRTYQWLWNMGYPDGFQVLCYNCNSVKGHYGKCIVHQIEDNSK